MSLSVWYWLYPEGKNPKEVHEVLRSAEEINQFFDALGNLYTGEAVINHEGRPFRNAKVSSKKSPTGWRRTPDHYVVIFVEDGYGVISYNGKVSNFTA